MEEVTNADLFQALQTISSQLYFLNAVQFVIIGVLVGFLIFVLLGVFFK